MVEQVSKRRGIFVVGTSMQVGTTTVAGGLALALAARGERVAVMKPLETGCSVSRDESVAAEIDGIPGELSSEARHAYERLNELVGPPPISFSTKTKASSLHPHDASWLVELVGTAAQQEMLTVNPYRYSAAVAPAVAARLAERPIEIAHLLSCLSTLANASDAVVIDGGGGLCEPLDEQLLMLDFVERAGLPVLIVGPSRYGVVSPVLAYRQLLEARGIAVAGVVLVRLDRRPNVEEAANPHLIDTLSGDVVRGVLPYLDDKRRNDAEVLGARFAVHVDVDNILPAL